MNEKTCGWGGKKMDLEKYWRQVQLVGKLDHVSEDGMMSLGSVFGNMKAEIKRLRTENERLKDDLDIFKDNFHDERRKARRYKKALEFYEDENNYAIVESLGLSPISGKPYRNSRIGLDRGKTAKEALEPSHD